MEGGEYDVEEDVFRAEESGFLLGFAVSAEKVAATENFGVEDFGESAGDCVFAGKREAEDVDGAGAEPLSDGGEFLVVNHW